MVRGVLRCREHICLILMSLLFLQFREAILHVKIASSNPVRIYLFPFYDANFWMDKIVVPCNELQK